jgi:hypothetical protein
MNLAGDIVSVALFADGSWEVRLNGRESATGRRQATNAAQAHLPPPAPRSVLYAMVGMGARPSSSVHVAGARAYRAAYRAYIAVCVHAYMCTRTLRLGESISDRPLHGMVAGGAGPHGMVSTAEDGGKAVGITAVRIRRHQARMGWRAVLTG